MEYFLSIYFFVSLIFFPFIIYRAFKMSKYIDKLENSFVNTIDALKNADNKKREVLLDTLQKSDIYKSIKKF